MNDHTKPHDLPPGLTVNVVSGEAIMALPLFILPLPEGRSLDLYHYTDREGFEGLTSPDIDWLPSLGGRSKPVPGSVRSLQPGDPVPPEEIVSRQSLSADLAALAASAVVGPSEQMLDLSSRKYGPGWYVTSLHPGRPTDELIRILWGGNQAKRTRTAYWIRIRVSEFKVKTPDFLRPQLKFVPLGDRWAIVGPEDKELLGESHSSVYLVSAGTRGEGRLGRVRVTTSYEESKRLIPPFRFLTSGWSNFETENQVRLLKFLGLWTDVHNVTPESPEGQASDLIHVLVERGQVNEALRRSNEFIACYPDAANLWSNRGVAFAKLGQRREAIECYIRALDIQPDFPQARINLTASLIVTGKFEQALSCVNDLLANYPDSADGWFNRGLALVNLAEHLAAIDSFDRFVALAPQHPRVARAKELTQECRRRCMTT